MTQNAESGVPKQATIDEVDKLFADYLGCSCRPGDGRCLEGYCEDRAAQIDSSAPD